MTTEPAPPAYGRAWWVGLTLGGLVLVYGLVGLLANAVSTDPPAWAAWLAVTLLVHDFVVVPAVLVVGRLAARLPGGWRAPVGAALAVSGVVVLVTLPAFLGEGRGTQPGNTSVLPNDYARNLLVLLSLVWTAAAAWALAGSARSPRSPRSPSDADEDAAEDHAPTS